MLCIKLTYILDFESLTVRLVDVVRVPRGDRRAVVGHRGPTATEWRFMC